ncbi:MAG TPA: outer membrane beta-barrel protein [Vicinamibacteria bacterium]|nr:outer membrane beta-barrel protein [Vicinamibacteria bacterium]
MTHRIRFRFIALVGASVLAVLGTTRVAHADTLLIPHAGVVARGDLDESHTTYGGTIAFMGDSAWGLEIEGTYTPDFFGEDEAFDFTDNNVTTLMASVLLGTGGDGGRLYLSAGAGLLKSRVADADEFFDVDSTDFGVSAGVGGMAFFSDRFGVRGDVRYFRNLADPESDDEFDIDFGDFSYWRATGGLVLRF